MMAALIVGQRDPQVLAAMWTGLRRKIPRLEEAFAGLPLGTFDDHHRFLLSRMLARIRPRPGRSRGQCRLKSPSSRSGRLVRAASETVRPLPAEVAGCPSHRVPSFRPGRAPHFRAYDTRPAVSAVF